MLGVSNACFFAKPRILHPWQGGPIFGVKIQEPCARALPKCPAFSDRTGTRGGLDFWNFDSPRQSFERARGENTREIALGHAPAAATAAIKKLWPMASGGSARRPRPGLKAGLVKLNFQRAR